MCKRGPHHQCSPSPAIQHVSRYPKVNTRKASNRKGCCSEPTLEEGGEAVPTKNSAPESKETAEEAKAAADLK